jgi:uncharacterized Tic20 family protein
MGSPTPGPGLNDDKTWIQIAHFGGALGALVGVGAGGWIAPLVALVGRGNVSPAVRAHAVAALNFQILVTLVTFAGWLTVCIVIGFVIIPIAVIAGVLFGVLAGVKSNEGASYKYPITINLVK